MVTVRERVLDPPHVAVQRDHEDQKDTQLTKHKEESKYRIAMLVVMHLHNIARDSDFFMRGKWNTTVRGGGGATERTRSTITLRHGHNVKIQQKNRLSPNFELCVRFLVSKIIRS